MSQPTKKPRPNKNKEALGKGIRSLLQNMDNGMEKTEMSSINKTPANPGIERIPLQKIKTNPQQPRQDFDETTLAELSESIKIHDVIQPITVSPINNNSYRLISGERRLRASQMAGLEDIPAYIRKTEENAHLELALLENLQREDLNAIEVALSMERLMDECDLTQEELATRVSKSRSTVTNFLRLLKLPPDIQVAVRSGIISMGHAKTLISISTIEKQLYVFKEILEKKLSVRQAEALVKKLNTPKKPVKREVALPQEFRKVQDNLSSHFSTRVKLNRNHKGKGSIVLDFYSDEELNHLLDLMLD